MKKTSVNIKAKIIANNKVGGNYFLCSILSEEIASKADCGQFIEIDVSGNPVPLLRRPLSIHRVRQGKLIDVLYEVVGEGTACLSDRRPGERLDIIGPLGTGFNYHLPFTNYHLPVLIAGGMGTAPLVFLAEKLRSSKLKPLVLIGARSKDHIVCGNEFKELGCKVKIATDDGSRGFKGRVTDLLKSLFPFTKYPLPITIYACGPRPMLKEAARISIKENIPAQLSLEEHMACGIGACLGCVVNTTEGYKRVCKDGPVFAASEIIWE